MQSRWRDRRTLHEILSERNPSNADLGVAYASFVCTVRVGYSPGIMLRNHPSLNQYATQELQKRFQERVRGNLYAVCTGGEYIPPSGKFAPQTVEWLVTELARPGRFEDIGAAVQQGAEEYQRRMIERGMRNYLVAAEYRTIGRALQERLENDKR